MKKERKINPSMSFKFSLEEDELFSMDFKLDEKGFDKHKLNKEIEIVDLKKYKYGRRKRSTTELF